MKCECGSTDFRTRDTRKIDAGVWRRRFCGACGAEWTTLEQRCETITVPYTRRADRRAAKAEVVAPDVPTVTGHRARPAKVVAEVVAPPVPDAITTPIQPAAPRKTAMRRAPRPVVAPTPPARPEPPAPQQVAQLVRSARDRIEDMKADRENPDYGWEVP